MALRPKSKPSATEGEFLFQLDPEPLEECVTAYAGIPLLVQTMRSLDVPGSVKQHLQVKQRHRGLDEAGYVESFVVLNALGGECLEDFDRLGPCSGQLTYRTSRRPRRSRSQDSQGNHEGHEGNTSWTERDAQRTTRRIPCLRISTLKFTTKPTRAPVSRR